ncbi:MAG: gamma-glutamyltransferase, partial [Planctomycetota bacterium]
MKAPTTRFALIRTALVLVPMALAACASTETGPKLGFETPMWAAERYDAGVVAADHPEASGAGAEILGAGGNAVDAAVATSFALSVVRPYSCGIGGGGFMVIHLADHPEFPAGYTTALNYRERAPGLMGPTYFEDNPEADSRRSGHAVGVPGTVAGLLYALEKYGTMDRAEVLAPAIRLARRGFAVDANFAQASRGLPGSDDIREGGRHRNPMQARALQLIADRGAAGFYEGELAEAIVGAVRADGGPLTFEDLARYRVSEVQPLEGRFLGRTVFTMPPPSSGGLAALQTFGVLERLAFAASEREGGQSPLARPEPSDPVYAHALLEALKHAFADRARWLGDPEFSDVPTEQLLAPSTLDNYAMDFDPAGVLDP